MTNTNKPGIAFWIISVIALIWNLMGVNAYLMQAFRVESALEEMTPEQLALLDTTPAWVTALFAIAVFAGALGCIALLMRKKMAVLLLTVSFFAATVQQLRWLFSDGRELFDQFQGTIMPIMIIVVCAFLVWYAKSQKAKGVLS
jgi:hypothetical protein